MIKVYGNKGCVNCKLVKNVLNSKDVNYEYLILDDQNNREKLIKKAEEEGQVNMPIVTKDNKIINWREL